MAQLHLNMVKGNWGVRWHKIWHEFIRGSVRNKYKFFLLQIGSCYNTSAERRIHIQISNKYLFKLQASKSTLLYYNPLVYFSLF